MSFIQIQLSGSTHMSPENREPTTLLFGQNYRNCELLAEKAKNLKSTRPEEHQEGERAQTLPQRAQQTDHELK